MKSTKNSRAVIVGIFILLGIAILVLTILTLGSQRKTFEKSIVLRAVFDDISGLQKGNNIWFSGVKIGTVKKISFYGNSQVEVDMNIEQNARQYIHKSSKARISSEGLIGNRIIAIDGGSANSPIVENGDMIGVEKAVNSDEMMNTLQSNNRNLLEITNDFKLVSKGIAQGKGTAGRLLSDDKLINELQATMDMLRKTSSNAQRISSSVADFAAQLNKKGALANDLVTDTIVFARLKATATQLQELSATASSVVSNLNNTTKGLNNSLNNRNTPVGMLLHDEDAATDIRVTLRNMQSASIRLNEDLEAAQHNFLLKGFFKKKAKREAQEAKNKPLQTAIDSTSSQ